MDEPGTRDPYRSWTRRPVVRVAATVLLSVTQVGRLSSGESFEVVTGVGVVLFWVSLFFLAGTPPEGRERGEAEAWRRRARRAALVFGFWAVVAWAWLGAAAAWYSVAPANFLVPAVPTLLAAVQLGLYRGAERIAEGQRRAYGFGPRTPRDDVGSDGEEVG